MPLQRGLAVHGLIVAAAAALGMAASAPPNIVMILVDDLGWGGIADNNPHVLGPRVSELKAESLSLTSHYVYKFCSPTRGSLLSGRYPMRLGSMKSNFIPWSRPDGLNPGFTLLPQRLAKRGFESHHVGKWHLGFYNATTLMPTARGFDSFFGYLAGEQDHFTQEVGSFIECKAVVDLTENLTAARGANGTYSGYLYNARAVAVAKTATEPFFLNYWLQNTHGPFEVPERYSALYRFKDPRQNTFNGMVSVVDEAVGNLTAALKARGVWSNTLVVYTHDNGASRRPSLQRVAAALPPCPLPCRAPERELASPPSDRARTRIYLAHSPLAASHAWLPRTLRRSCLTMPRRRAARRRRLELPLPRRQELEL